MSDFTIEPGQTLDLTDPDDPEVEEDGEVVREPEPSEDDSGGGGGSDPEPDSDGGDSSGGDSGGDSTSVVVTGDPGSQEGITTVGQGDTLEEARTDAATNPDFDADEGEEIDRIEEQLGTDQPGINPEDQASDRTSVVVTGDPGSREGITTVGQAQTLRGARTQAALNQRFDAAQGEPVDAIETRINAGQGSGTTLKALKEAQERKKSDRSQRNIATNNTRSQRNFTSVDNQEKEPEQNGARLFRDAQESFYNRQVAREQLTENQRQFKQAANPEIPVLGNFLQLGGTVGREGQDVIEGLATGDDEKARESFVDVEEEFQIQGMGILAQGQRFGEDVGQRLAEENVDPRFPGTETVEKAGIIAEDLGIEQGEKVTETTRQFERDLIQGTATAGTAAGGIAVATPGAASENVRGTLQNAGVETFEGDEATGFGEAAAGGVKLTGKELGENPVEFVGTEAGEEVAETAGGFLIAGPAGAAASAAPIPTPTPEITPDVTIQSTDVLNPSDVKARARDTGRSIYKGITDPNAVGSGPGAFLPADSRPESNPSPDTTPSGRERSRTDPRNERPERSRTGQDRFKELQEFAQSDPRRTEGFGTDVRGELDTENVIATEQEITTETTTQAQQADTTGIDFTGSTSTAPTLEDDVGVESRPESDVLSEPDTEPEVITEGKPETETKPETTPETTPDIITDTKPETKVEPTPEIISQPETTPETTLDIDLGEEDDEDDGRPGEGIFSGKETEFQASVGAEILGITAEEKPGRLSVQDPTSLRPIIDQESNI